MTRMSHIAISVVLALSSCATLHGEPGIASTTASATEPALAAPGSGVVQAGPTIGTLQRRSDALVIMASGSGPRFSVRNADGQVVSRGLSEAELRRRHGELHRTYRSSVARAADRAFLDARAETGAGAGDVPTQGPLGGLRSPR